MSASILNKPNDEDSMFFAPTTLSTLRRFTPLALVAGLALVSGCTCSTPVSGFGDFSFDWSFDGIQNCGAAGVDVIEYTLEDSRGGTTTDAIDCIGGGVSIRDIEAGEYTLFVDAIRGNLRVYESAAINLSVRSERNSELGVIQLNGVGGGGATLAGFWAFAFPTDDSSVTTCEIAGVESVDVQVFEAGTNILVPDASFSFPCDVSGFEIAPLPPGFYDVALLASGTYEGQLIDYYATIVEGIELTPDFTLDLGTINLLQIPESFGDFNINVTLPASCAALGSPDLTFEFIRLGETEADDLNDGSVTVACDVLAVEQFIFVPGDYFILGSSSNNSVSGQEQTFIEPNAVTNVAFDFFDD